MNRFFLSYSGSDRVAAEALARGLMDAGTPIWADMLPDCLVPGKPWPAQLERALLDCKGYLILIGAKRVQGWVRFELDYAVNRQAREADFPVVPLILPGTNISDLPPILGLLQAIRLPDDPGQLQRDKILELAETLRGMDSSPRTLEAPSICPFPGLEPFDESNARFFFGRDREVHELVAGLGATPSGYRRWLQIEGASGAGKSSLARAGLIPAVRRGWIDQHPQAWRIAVMRPGADPVMELALALHRSLIGKGQEPPPEKLHERLSSNELALVYVLREFLDEKQNLLLLVDQLEETFTLAQSDAVESVDALLAKCVEDPQSRLHLVTTIRSDFLGQFPRLPALGRMLNKSATRFYLGPMEQTSLRATVTGPARLAGLDWQVNSLPERIVRETVEAPGGLPLLGHLLKELWEHRQGNTLLADEYNTLGGVGGALAKSADDLLRGLDELHDSGRSDRDRARELLLSLVVPGQGTQDARRVATRQQALTAAGGGAAAERVLLRLSGQPVKDQPVSQGPSVRLIFVEGEDRVELAHEELLRSWATLKDWINDHRSRMEIREQLESIACAWEAAHRPDSVLPDQRMLQYYARAQAPSSLAQEFLQEAERRVDQLQERRAGLILEQIDYLTKTAKGLGGLDPEKRRELQDWFEQLREVGATAEEFRSRLSRKISTGQDSGQGPHATKIPHVVEIVDRLMDPEREPLRTANARRRIVGVVDFNVQLKPLEIAARWERVEQSIAEEVLCPAYSGMPIVAQDDLVPIGIHPRSLLWEFAVEGTGKIPCWSQEADVLDSSSEDAIVLVLIPGGEFAMGSEPSDRPFFVDELSAGDDEQPVRQVSLLPFLLSKAPVTRSQWDRLQRDALGEEGERGLPMTGVSWTSIKQCFADWSLELPSEAQWEFACRAGTTSVFSSGDRSEDLHSVGWVMTNSRNRLHPVGTKQANAYGLHDMHGNVWEWCEDSYLPSYAGAPVDGSPRLSGSKRKVIRGGSFEHPARVARSASREGIRPEAIVNHLGVRATRAVRTLRPNRGQPS